MLHIGHTDLWSPSFYMSHRSPVGFTPLDDRRNGLSSSGRGFSVEETVLADSFWVAMEKVPYLMCKARLWPYLWVMHSLVRWFTRWTWWFSIVLCRSSNSMGKQKPWLCETTRGYCICHYTNVHAGMYGTSMIEWYTGWWFQTCFEFSISYMGIMGCHPSHWLSLHHVWRWLKRTTKQYMYIHLIGAPLLAFIKSQALVDVHP